MQTGQLLHGRYQLGPVIGRGSFGIVHRAEDTQRGEEVAIKLLMPEAAKDASLRHRLHREAKLASELTNPHAIRIHEVSETADGQVFIVMELLRGKELIEVLRDNGTLPPKRAADIVRQTLLALAEAHHLGVIHRDLKPENVFVCMSEGKDHVKVLDFGIAKVAGTEDGSGLTETAKLTVDGTVLGTPTYMSPEQCRGEKLTPASDLYSLGIMAYEMLTGSPPFTSDQPMQLLMLHNVEKVPPLPAKLADSPLGQAVMRSLAKEPGERFASAEEFLAALDQPAPAAERAPTPAPQPVASAGKSEPTYATSRNRTAADSGLKSFVQRNLFLVVAALIGILLLVAWLASG